jgi:hypothetical protein
VTVDEEEWLGWRFEEHRVVPRKGGFQIAKDLLYRGNLLVFHGRLLGLARELVILNEAYLSHQASVTGLTCMTPHGGGM